MFPLEKEDRRNSSAEFPHPDLRSPRPSANQFPSSMKQFLGNIRLAEPVVRPGSPKNTLTQLFQVTMKAVVAGDAQYFLIAVGLDEDHFFMGFGDAGILLYRFKPTSDD
ncbi:hypothetical protein PSHT_05290 [Puccinia striiformis]|uniref:Uncharacterized protein n=1 Tax=Puccinia striiformis TaxID=27350 RepID=A0A2S4WB04_9BASI|nr:hypothetical protein PSHT_05290 [Puccinia striiformis]